MTTKKVGQLLKWSVYTKGLDIEVQNAVQKFGFEKKIKINQSPL